MRLIITTHQREKRQETLANLPEAVADQVEMWVQESERERYDLYYEGVHSLPAHITTLGATRQYLVDLYWGEKIVLMDDDLTFYWREDPDKWNLTIPPPDELAAFFADELDDTLDRYAHVGLSGREGQNREMSYAVENTRYMRFLAYNTALWPQDRRVRMDRLDGMSDFDTNMQLLRAGLSSQVFYRWAQGQRATQTPGGMAGQRTRDSHFAEVRQMCEMHPGLIMARKKVNVSAGAFGVRDEVTVQWKSALGWDSRVEAVSTFVATKVQQLEAKIAGLEAQNRQLAEAVDCNLEALIAAEARCAVLEQELEAERAKNSILAATLEARLEAEKEARLAVPRKIDRRKKIHTTTEAQQ